MMARELLPNGAPGGLVLCIPVREVKAWFLADAESLKRYLGVASLRASDPESIDDPKRLLIDCARRSEKRRIRESLVPVGLARVGPLYNSTMLEYVIDHWRIDEAVARSPSLQRFVRKIAALA